jgi:hypothetical protein
VAPLELTLEPLGLPPELSRIGGALRHGAAMETVGRGAEGSWTDGKV